MKTSLPDPIEVIAPNLKRRLSGVTATIARLVPDEERRNADAAAAVEAIRALRKGGKVTVEEILSMRDEGRR